MKYRTLKRADFMISEIGIGCWAYGGGEYWGAQSQNDVDAVVHSAIDQGASFFDTARVYNDGLSEKALGSALKGRRQQAIICSKVAPANAYYHTLRAECELSLTNLKTDYLDIYMLHWPINPYGLKHFTGDTSILKSPPTIEEALTALSDLKKEGKIRAIGISNFGPKQMEEALSVCSDIAVNELAYNIYSRAIEAEIIPYCEEHDIGILAYMALQQGLLTGKYTSAEQVPPHQAHSRHFSQEHGGTAARHYEKGAEAEIFESLPALESLAAECGCTLAQLSIAWILSRTSITSALVGCRNLKQLNANLPSSSIRLPADVIAEIDRISQPALIKLGNNPDYYENTKNSRIY